MTAELWELCNSFGQPDESGVASLLKQSADPNGRLQSGGRTCLMAACARGHSILVAVLVEARADVHIVDKAGWTALHVAADYGHEAVVLSLLQSKADPDKPNLEQQTPLGIACENGDEAVIELMMQARQNQKHESGSLEEKLLALASAFGREESSLVNDVKALLDRGTTIDHPDPDAGRTSLMWAAARGRKELARLLLAYGANVHAIDNTGSTALHIAAEYGQVDVARLLLKYKADLQLANFEGLRAVEVAQESTSSDVVDLLTHHLSELDLSPGESKEMRAATIELLDVCSAFGKVDIGRAEALLAKTADPNYRHKESGRNALQSGTARGHKDVVALLLKHKADPCATDRVGGTALHLCAEYGHEEVAQLLIAAKANVQALNADGETAAAVGRDNGNSIISDLLESQGSYVSKREAEVKALSEELIALCNTGPSPQDRNKDKGPFLEQVLGLLSKGASLNYQAQDGETALSAACKHGSSPAAVAAVSAILDCTTTVANVRVADLKGETPLHLAVRSALAGDGSPAVVSLLLHHRADPNLKNSAGESALSMAKSDTSGSPNTVLSILFSFVDEQTKRRSYVASNLAGGILRTSPRRSTATQQ